MIAQRIALGIILLFAVSVLIFAGTQILPGDVAASILGQAATPEALANLREELGLNEPAHVRYFQWLGGVLTGDLGTALSNRQDIATSIGKRLSNTLFLASCAAVISVPLAILLGLIAVRYRNGPVDKAISGLALASTSLPEFFIGYVLVFFFAVKLQWFPGVSTVYDGMPFLDRLRAVALPTAALTLVVLAHMMRMTRAAILNVMQSAYIETAELKGLSAFDVIRRHAFPNAIAPIVNVVMLNLAFLVVGVVVIEVIFVYPGMGQYLVDHVSKRDVPVVQAVGLIFAAIYIGLNIIADIAAILANPVSGIRSRGDMLSLRQIPLGALIGLVLTTMFLIMAIFAPLLAPYPHDQIVGGVWNPMSAEHWLGTDNLGRDLLSRVIYGARTTIFIATLATALSFTMGAVLGFTAAVVGGWFDMIMSRFVDLLMSIPTLIFGLVVLSVLPSTILTLILVMGLLDSTRVYRLSRAVAADINVMDFVEAAKLRGEGQGWIIFREILPNALSPLVSELGLRFIFAVLFLSALSFLGLGVQPPEADWGGMVKENKDGIVFGIPAALIPAAAIAALAISVNLVADWVLNRTTSLKGGRGG